MSLTGVRLLSAPWLFRGPLKRFRGWTAWNLILVKPAPGAIPDDLVVHELCHVWQMQHHPLAVPLSVLLRGYRESPFELEARRATAAVTRRDAAHAPGR